MTRLAALALALAAGGAAAQQPIGWVEPVAIGGSALVLRAKIDTGADVSSLDIDELRIERRGEDDWAVFTVGTGEGAPPARFERRVERYTMVKRLAGGAQRRPVVRLELCLGTVAGESEVNLVDRESMRFPMLVGRSFLERRFVVDPARRMTTAPACARRKPA